MSQRLELQIIVPNRRAAGVVNRVVNVTDHAWDDSDLSYRVASSVTSDPLVLVTGRTARGDTLLEQEIVMGTHLVVSHPPEEYPPQLSRLIGYRDDLHPRMAVLGYGGQPLQHCASRLDDDARAEIVLGLLIALDRLAGARVVHRALTPRTVVWDTHTRTVRIVGFGRAAFVGAPRAHGPDQGPWSAPEQRAGTGTCSTADDVYSLTVLMFWLYSREEPEADLEAMRRRVQLQDVEVAKRLQGAFAENPAERPTLADLSIRWRLWRRRVVPPERLDDSVAREFHDLRQQQARERSLLIDPSSTSPVGKPLTLELSRSAIVTGIGFLLVIVIVLIAVAV